MSILETNLWLAAIPIAVFLIMYYNSGDPKP